MDVQTSDKRAIFEHALEFASGAEREAYLEDACAGKPEMRAQVDSLLKAHNDVGSFLDGPAYDAQRTAPMEPISEQPGTIIGPYKLLEQIGEGGFGVVYMAEQQQPVRRKVALKVVKPGMDSRQVLARFEAERQALAIMDHPNIAKVFDAGATDSGRPYFVMELVKGEPITEFCDRNQLSPRERLELFGQVCHAVQHAHQKGIIHRDIKPTNVLVATHDTTPVVKVIDFGIAKALGQELTDKTLFTGFAQFLGTPLYMSPEQAGESSLDVDTRSDIYSLGVLLYELLTGATPFDKERFRQAAHDEIRRIIREEEPPKPSTRLSESKELLPSISASRHTEPAKLTRLVRGELDWIVMKALEKDRGRRYETANGFAADIERYLRDEAVHACPPSARYRLRKFARRNKVAFAVSGLVLFFLVLLGSEIGWTVRDRAARRMAAEQEVNLALREAAQLQEQAKWPEAFSAAKRAEGLLIGGGSGELRERVHNIRKDLEMVVRLDELRARWGDHPGHESQDRAYARLFAEFGVDVESLGQAEVAARIRCRPSIAVRLAAALDEWAVVLRDWPIAHPDRQHDPAIWKGLVKTARLADPDPWRSELRELTVREDLIGLRKLADSSDVAALPVQSLQHMGNALIFGGDAPACVAWLRKAHRQHPGDVLITFDLAFHLGNLPSADRSDVLRFAEAALAARPQSASVYTMVGFSLDKLGRSDEAIENYRRALELKPDDARLRTRLRNALVRQERLDEAIACYEEAIQLSPKSAVAFNDFAWMLATCADAKFRNAARAVELGKQAVELSPKTGNFWNTLGVAQYRDGNFKEAVSALQKYRDLRTTDAEWSNPFLLAMAHWQLGDKEEARQWFDKGAQWMDAHNARTEAMVRFRKEAAELLGVNEKK